MNKNFKYDFKFGKCENLYITITDQDDIAKEMIKDGYIPYIDPSIETFNNCFSKLNDYYYVLVKTIF